MSPPEARRTPGSARANALWRVFSLLLAILSPSWAFSSPFDCINQQCGLPVTEAYPHLVLGTVTSVATDSEVGQVYEWARENGYWSEIPDDRERFIRTMRLVSVTIPGPDGPEDWTLIMGREHFSAIHIAPGDFVRYTPHQTQLAAGQFDDPAEAAYWNLYGCIAVLCRAEDAACPARYRPGVFNRDNGVQLDLHSGAPLIGGTRIETGTYLPLGSGG